ncbi:hypothetical protein [Lapidilactobacillus luobeiensis]|uniref:hypothetical protein n=1 Tax=Lapidilactobacillus luobeiensis TaxID=2950371 RepID=UPI0021C3AF29|nr:hypothetical protein [Lapidilactobacillus luobeiensis]
MTSFPAKKIAYLAIMAALAIVLGLATSFLPNFSLTLAFYFLLSVFSGLASGWSVMLVAVLASNLRTGIGPWTLFQIIAYSCLLLLWYGYTRSDFIKKIWLSALVAAGLAFTFGFWNALLNVPFYHLPNFWVYYLQGLPFDASLCLATGLGYWLMARYLLPIMIHRLPEMARSKR